MALSKFINKHHTKVYNFCYSILGCPLEAQELTQDVFLKIWKVRENLDLNKSVEGLLYSIAKNLTLNRLRDNKKLIESCHIHADVGITENTMEQVLFNNMEEEVRKVIDALPERRRMIFELSRFEGLSNKEISEKMDISINTVEGQMRKALQFLHANTDHLFVPIYLFGFFI